MLILRISCHRHFSAAGCDVTDGSRELARDASVEANLARSQPFHSAGHSGSSFSALPTRAVFYGPHLWRTCIDGNQHTARRGQGQKERSNKQTNKLTREQGMSKAQEALIAACLLIQGRELLLSFSAT